MKKIFYLLGVVLFMASCGTKGEGQTENHINTEEEDTFGMEMPIEAFESTTPYEGIGNMSDGE